MTHLWYYIFIKLELDVVLLAITASHPTELKRCLLQAKCFITDIIQAHC